MSNLAFCIERRKAERPAFVKVLKAVPGGRLDYRPDPKARTAAELAWLFAAEEDALVKILDAGVVEWKDEKPPARIEDIVAAFERSANAVDERLAKIDQAGWEKKAKFNVEGNVAWEDTTSAMVWGFLFVQIRHRGE